MEYITGGVCAAKGFTANAVHCGIRKNKDKKDLALIFSQNICSAASVYTLNKVQGAPITVTRNNLKDGKAQAIICNSGNANTCNANGIEIAEQTCDILGAELNISPSNVIVASTGVIGKELSIQPIASGMQSLVSGLSSDKSLDAAHGIMTTDTKEKEAAVSFVVGGKKCVIGGIAKGSGMIHPNMATMLVFITTDVAINPEMLNKALVQDADKTFNMISVDGDTSTNDMVSVMANGLAGNSIIDKEGDDYNTFCVALNAVTQSLCKMIAKDGEGATKLLECEVIGALDINAARLAAKSVISSSLFKAAMFGADANWGRVLCAVGYSGAQTDVSKIDVSFISSAGSVNVCKNGSGVEFSEELAKKILSEDEIIIKVDLNSGDYSAVAWGCDLTYDYVKINGDYRS